MDKKSKEALRRRYKKARMQSSSSESSSSSDSSSSYSSSGSERHRKKKLKQAVHAGRSSSTSGDERRKREKREHCQKKLEAKRNHLKRKLKEAKLKKRAAAALGHRDLSPNTQAKLKKIAERKHLRAQSKERRERERLKHRAALREREREHHRRTDSRSPTKITKIRIHQDVKRQKSPPRMHHQLMSREKIIIQARTRSHTPSAERERLRHEQKLRHEDMARERERRERERDRAEREAAREKERAEALARCQERQRERERIAREKLRREEEEKKYGSERGGDRLVPRAAERDIGMSTSRAYNSRERSMDSERGRHLSKRDLEVAYEREREYLEAERRGLLDREDLRREREYLASRRRDLSPSAEHYAGRLRDPRDVFEEERERAYVRPYLDDARHARERDAGWLPRDIHERELRDPRDFREVEHDLRYAEERERELLMRERTLAGRGDWKTNWADSPGRSGGDRNWEEGAPHAPRSGFVGGPKRGGGNVAVHSKLPREQRANSEPDWDAEEGLDKTESASVRDGPGFSGSAATTRDPWVELDHRDLPREKPLPGSRQPEHLERRWQSDWREGEEAGRIVGEVGLGPLHHHRGERGARSGFRRGLDHPFRGHPPPLMTLPVQPPGAYGNNPRFPTKRNMTYTNPNLLKKQQAIAAAKAAAQATAVAAATTAVAAAKAAAQSAANATTNPGILGQVSSKGSTADSNEKPEAGEILPEQEESEAAMVEHGVEALVGGTATAVTEEQKVSGELSEISDSDDDILNKAERKSKSELEETASDVANKIEPTAVTEKTDEAITAELERGNEDEEMLDFEEISDGELEEEARHKGVGDALGVDWASLIAETKSQAENASQPNAEQPTTAKQKWEPHRIILDVGISLRMAGEEYAKRILADAHQKLQNELKPLNVKCEIKEEISSSTADEDSQSTTAVVDTMTDTEKTNQNEHLDKKGDITNKITIKSGEVINMDSNALNMDHLQPLACMQVAHRKRLLDQRQLFANACGPNSRALSARQDLKLRRQLCGLPADEPTIPIPMPTVSEKIKALALESFKRSLEVK